MEIVTITRSNILKLSYLNSNNPSPINLTTHSKVKMDVKIKLTTPKIDVSKDAGSGYRSNAKQTVFSRIKIIIPPLKYLCCNISRHVMT